MRVPEAIIAAINSMLTPYGEHYTPGQEDSTGATPAGYLRPADAARYIGCSRTYLYLLTREGHIPAIKLNKNSRNGKVVYAVSDLEDYIKKARR